LKTLYSNTNKYIKIKTKKNKQKNKHSKTEVFANGTKLMGFISGNGNKRGIGCISVPLQSAGRRPQGLQFWRREYL
jgi:hypothetical protein